jgi:hypothetical protein
MLFSLSVDEERMMTEGRSGVKYFLSTLVVAKVNLCGIAAAG